MTLGSALSISTNALTLAQEGITTSSNNIANIGTPGYIKQKTLQESVVINGMGQGAQIAGLSASVDEELLKSIRTQTTSLGNNATTDAYYESIQRLYGQPNADNSISSEIDAFFAAYQNLSTNPETPSLRSAALNASKDLASKISLTANGLQDLRYKADKDINTTVNVVNTHLDNIVNYNAEIVKFSEQTSGYINIKQKMTEALSKLSEYINVATSFDINGKVTISTANGVSLIDDATNARLEYSPASSAETFKSDGHVNALKVRLLNPDGTKSTTSIDITTSGISTDLTTTLTDGSIKGLIDMRDRTIPDLIEQLDTFAAALTNEVNAVQNNGFGFPPPSSLTGTTSVTSTTEVDFTGSVRIAVIKSDGTPAPSPYDNETYMRPLTLDLGTLNSGNGAGRTTVQTIMDQINAYYGPVQNIATVGNLRNVQLEATSNTINNTGATTFDLKLDNTSTKAATMVVQSVVVIDPNTNIQYNIATLPNPNSYTLAAGDMHSTGQPFSIDFSAGGLPNVSNYTIRVSTQVTDASGNISTADVDYNITNNVTGAMNNQYNATAVTSALGTSTFYPAPSGSTFASVSLVDSSGNPVASGQPGIMKITTSAGRNYSVIIDELDSKEVGIPGADSSSITNRGFSHYFGLNNLFVDNGQVAHTAQNMTVRSDIQSDANLLTTGHLTLSNQPADTTTALYTYEAGSGNNKAAIALSELNQKSVYFAASGSLPSVSLTFSGYSGDIIGSVASDALNATNQKDSKQLGMDGLQTLFQKSAGVNSDEELSRIIELQNNFSASAQIISIVQKLFEILNQSIR